MYNIRDNSQILIVGCGRLGSSIANTISNNSCNVTIIDIDKEAFRKLSPSFSGLYVVGDATDMDVLKEVEIEKTDVLIGVTNSDNINILISQMAKVEFGVKDVIVRLYDPQKRVLLEEFGIKSIIPSKLSLNEVDKIIGGEEIEE